ncbi:unnamed protein product, partial [Ixodes hexagonus]
DGLEGPWLRRDWVQAEDGAKDLVRRRVWTSDTGQLDQADFEGSGDVTTSPGGGHVDVPETVVLFNVMTPAIVPSSSSSMHFEASDDLPFLRVQPTSAPTSDGYESMVRSSMPYDGPSSSLQAQLESTQSSEFAFVLSSFPVNYTSLTPALTPQDSVDYSSVQPPDETAVFVASDANSSALIISAPVTIVSSTSMVPNYSLNLESTPTQQRDDSELVVSSTSVDLPIVALPSFSSSQTDFISTYVENTVTSGLSTTVPTTLTTTTSSTLSSSETMLTSQDIVSTESSIPEPTDESYTYPPSSLQSSTGVSGAPTSTATETNRYLSAYHVIDPSSAWFSTDPPVSRTRDWFLTTMSRWFVPRPTSTPDWNRSPPVTSSWPTAMLPPQGAPSNATPPSWQELNDKMKFWIKTVLRLHRFNQTDTEKLASHLAFVYEKAFANQQAPRRGKRYSGRSMAVQVVNLSVDYKERLMSLVYTLSQEGRPVPAQHAVDAMSSVDETDMSRLLGYEVITKAEPYLKPAPSKTPLPLVWIVTGVLLGILVFVIAFLIIYCKCCRPKFAGASLRKSGSIHSYGRENRLKMFEGSPGTFGTLTEKSYKDVFTSPIHIPSASSDERAPHASRPRPKKLSEYYINQAFEPDRRHRISTVTNVTSENHAYANDEPDIGEVPEEGLYDRVPPIPAHEVDGPQPLPRRSLRPEADTVDPESDSDTSCAAALPETRAEDRKPDNVVFLLSSKKKKKKERERFGVWPLALDRRYTSFQRERKRERERETTLLEHQNREPQERRSPTALRKRRVSPSSSDVRRSSSLRAPKPGQRHTTTALSSADRTVPPAETAAKRDAPTQTQEPAESKPRVIWSICKTSEAAAQTSLSACNGEHGPGLTAGVDNKTDTPAVIDIHKPTQTVINAIRGELRKFNAAHRTHHGESFA